MGILSGLAYGLAGGVEGAAKGAEDVADSQIKLNNAQLLQKQLSDLKIQEEQSIADHKVALEHAEEARTASMAVTKPGAEQFGPSEDGSPMPRGPDELDYSATRKNLISHGMYTQAAELDKAQGEKTLGYGAEAFDADGNLIASNYAAGRNAAAQERADAALHRYDPKTMDPLSKAMLHEKIMGYANQVLAKTYRNPTLGVGLDGKPIADDAHANMVGQLYSNDLFDQFNKDPEKMDMAGAQARAVADADAASAAARAAVAKAHGGKFDPSDPAQLQEHQDRVRSMLRARLAPAPAAAPDAAPGGDAYMPAAMGAGQPAAAAPAAPSGILAQTAPAAAPGIAPAATPAGVIVNAARGFLNQPTHTPPPRHIAPITQ